MEIKVSTQKDFLQTHRSLWWHLLLRVLWTVKGNEAEQTDHIQLEKLVFKKIVSRSEIFGVANKGHVDFAWDILWINLKETEPSSFSQQIYDSVGICRVTASNQCVLRDKLSETSERKMLWCVFSFHSFVCQLLRLPDKRLPLHTTSAPRAGSYTHTLIQTVRTGPEGREATLESLEDNHSIRSQYASFFLRCWTEGGCMLVGFAVHGWREQSVTRAINFN